MSKLLYCDANTAKSIHQRTKLLILALQKVSFLTEIYILDYFVEEVWTKLPSSWSEVIKNFEISDLVLFLNLDENVRFKKTWPLSLLALRACVKSLALCRKSISSPKIIQDFLLENFYVPQDGENLDLLNDESDWSSCADEFNILSGQHKQIPEFCRKHVKPKKQHEIFRLGKIFNSVLTCFGLEHIIDIGSGLGHLSRLLTFSYNFNVATIEASHNNVSGAITFDEQAYRSMKGLKKHEVVLEKIDILPLHVEESVNLRSSAKSLKKIIDQAWNSDKTRKPIKFALLGLHTCGNLAETVLKTFVRCEESQVLLLVGCCYMKMEPDSKEQSYPLSNYVKSFCDHSLSYEAKELACHALEMYTKRLEDNSPSLKIHCYRATLEKCILDHYPDHKHLGLRGVKHAELLDFPKYAEQALSKVSINIPKETLSSAEVNACLNRWKEVLFFYSVRLITAPLIESLILLDRLLFLFEQGYPCCLAPVFDPTLSPRNFILLSFKNNKLR